MMTMTATGIKKIMMKTMQSVFLFTDRSIYRPGQLVYFKGIGVTKDYENKKIKTA